MLRSFNLEDCRPVATPMETCLHLSVHDAGEYFDAVLYQQAVGCLIYVCITRPDIQYAVSQVSRFMHSPGIRHWQVVKRIFCYLSGTRHLGLFYPKGVWLHQTCMLFQIPVGLVVMTRMSTSDF